MFRRIAIVFSLIVISSFSASAQNDLKIRKSVKIKMPGMESMMAGMPPSAAMDAMNSFQTIYIKGSKTRTETQYKKASMTGMKTRKMVAISQCETGRHITFNEEKKKYYTEDQSVDPKSRKGGFVTISMVVTDTGERMKLFGFDARRYTQKITITPSKNACSKEAMSLTIDGWYADLPTYSCPARPDFSEMQTSTGCYDETVFEMKGAAIKGFPVKEIKTMTVEGQPMIIEEEIVALERTNLLDALFEPPANYAPGNSKAEVMKEDGSSSAPSTPMSAPSENNSSSIPVGSTPGLAPPKAGLESVVVGPKKPGTIRIGVAKPKVTTPETKNDPMAGSEIATAVVGSFVESLKADGIEAVALDTDFPENECAERQCDYVLHSTVVQKRGGGMFGKMIAMSAASVAGAFIPGIGGMVASTVASQVMGNVMMKSAKAKDEFALDYKLADMNKSIIATAAAKKKTEKDGEDILTPMIGEASKTLLTKVRKP